MKRPLPFHILTFTPADMLAMAKQSRQNAEIARARAPANKLAARLVPMLEKNADRWERAARIRIARDRGTNQS